MKTFSDEDEKLAALLQARMPALPDHGFSAKVVARLPPARRSFRGLAWAAGGAAAGVGFAVLRGASWSDLVQTGPQIMTTFASLLSVLVDPWLLLALSIAGVSLVITYLINRGHAVRVK